MRRHHYPRVANTGFTLIEMMITLVIAAILIMVVVPGFTDMIANNRMRSEVYAMRALLMEARSEAMTERRNVTVCKSKNGTSCSGNWNEGYIAFFDGNADGLVNTFDADEDGVVSADETDRVILSRTPDASTINIGYSNTDSGRVLYNSRGNASRGGGADYNGTFNFCDKRGVSKAAGLIVSIVGTASAAVDNDDPADDIVNFPNDKFTNGENFADGEHNIDVPHD